MRVVVIGAGVVGVTTAYVLARDGHNVSVIEREPSTAMESSFANGGQLSFGFAAPMASRDLLQKAPRILLGRDPAFRLPLTFLLRHAGWAARFAHACLPGPGQRYGRELLAMAQRSRGALDRLCTETGAHFERRRTGKLIVYSNRGALDAAVDAFCERGLDVKALDATECAQLDPALHQINGALAGGVWIENDEVGDAEMFCRELAARCRERYGVEFAFNDNVQNITPQQNGQHVIRTAAGTTLHGDAVVLCTGASGNRLLTQLGLRLPVVPVTGYSLTAQPGPNTPAVAVTDADRKFVCSRIGRFVRIAGFADFGSIDSDTRHRRIHELIAAARQRFPAAADYSQLVSTWSGVRPATPTSLPIVGPSRVPGVYLNMGHGMYGWTLSAATAEHVASHIQPITGHRNAA